MILEHLQGHLLGYLDPGTGSFILQMVIAFFLGTLFALKLFWTKIKTFFLKLFGKMPEIEETEAAQAEEIAKKGEVK